MSAFSTENVRFWRTKIGKLLQIFVLKDMRGKFFMIIFDQIWPRPGIRKITKIQKKTQKIKNVFIFFTLLHQF